MVFPLQILGFAFALFMLFLTFYNYKRKRFSSADVALWTGVWLFFIGSVSLSGFLEQAIQPLRIERVFDFILAGGLGIVLCVSFVMYNKVKDSENRVRELVRKLALEKK
ncbi:MAG: DUF2304 domain-containing protein [Candidatus Micrarchaeota archaeon]|nr:DUF2304 domain-containing protein [Candidatus Micrarchaeota archaeon]